MALRTTPIRRIGSRTSLLMGGDRELVLISGLLAATLIFVAFDWMAFFYGVGLWFFALWVLRKMGKADPLMRHVYLRNRLYKSYYPPRSTPYRVNGDIKNGWH